MSKFFRLLTVSFALVFAATSLACGEPEEHDNHDNHDDYDIHGLELIDRSDESVLAEAHGDHWHPGALVMAVDDDHLSIGFRFLDHDDEDLHIHLDDPEWEIEVHAHDSGVVDIAHHGDHVDIDPSGEGETELHFELLHDGDVVFTAPDLDVVVVDQAVGDLEVGEFALLDRAHDPHEEIADVHGDHWDGDFAAGITLTATEATPDPESSDWYDRGEAGTEPEAVSLGVSAFDTDSNEISIPGQYRFEAVHAHSEDEDYVFISESHGDHVHIVGIGAGHAHVIFQLVDQSTDDVVYESPEFEFDVHAITTD